MPSMGFTPPRPRLVHANSFHFKSTLLEPPAVPLEERAKSPKKMKKKNKKKTKSHGERDLFPHKGEEVKDEERKEDMKRMIKEDEYEIQIEKVGPKT